MWEALFPVLLLAAALNDLIKREIHPAITLFMIFSGLISSALSGSLFNALLSLAFSLVLAYPLTYMGWIGGGDYLLLAGIASWKPLTLGLPTFIVVYPLAVLLSWALYPLIYFRGLSKIVGRKWVLALLPLPFLPIPAAIVYAGIVGGFVWLRNAYELFTREKRVDELKPEDVLIYADPCLPRSKRVLGKGDIERLRRCGRERVVVLEDLPPFAPFIALALLLLPLIVQYSDSSLIDVAKALLR